MGPINDYGYDIDVMVEAKMKEQSLIQYQKIQNKILISE